jgi:uncharacterized protein YkwD
MRMLPILVLLLGVTSPLCAQNADISKLSSIIKNANTDSVEKTERLAAIYFHEKINQYRVANKKSLLGWDDTVWLAARNHCNWMMANDQLSHEETSGTNLFNGQWPGDRYSFASNGKGSCDWSGENALYNYSGSPLGCSENALAIANYSFEGWRKSPGHNENMLNAASRIHGVAFRIAKDGKVWATDLFCYTPPYSPIQEKPAPLFSPNNVEYVYTTTETPAATSTASSEKGKFVSASEKFVRLDLGKTASDLQTALYSSSTLHHSKSMARAAQKHAAYMATNSKLTHDEKKQKRKYYAGSPRKRIVKASRGAKLFHKSSTHYVESIALISADAATLNISELSKTVAAALDKERSASAGNPNAIGFGVMIKRTKNELKIYVVREERVKDDTSSDDY